MGIYFNLPKVSTAFRIAESFLQSFIK